MRRMNVGSTPAHVLVIGGAGFIGSHLAEAFLRQGSAVTIYDNFSRGGATWNARRLREQTGDRLHVLHGDIRRLGSGFCHLLDTTDLVIHTAGQVAVTTSLRNPWADFEINAVGTLKILEAIRGSRRRPSLIFSSTNKVYGGLEQLKTRPRAHRHVFANAPYGVPETHPLDFCSPYGCSKGASEQYVLDYARTYGLQAVVLRKSCIYGPHQFGMEDQGWVAWLTIASLLGRPITIYGDGKQLRDVLYIDDLVAVYRAVAQRMDAVSGQAFNIGGGPRFTLSLLELLELLTPLLGRAPTVRYQACRPSDQRVYVSDIRKAQRLLGWQPRVAPRDGVARLYQWAQANVALFRRGAPGVFRKRLKRVERVTKEKLKILY